MKDFLLRFSLVCCCLLFMSTAIAQQARVTTIEVRGRVADGTDDPLIGTKVTVKGNAALGSIADVEGNFIIKGVPSNATLVFTYIGYKSVEVPVNGRTFMDVIMEEDANTIEGVVVTGFQTIQKANFTGSAVKINADDLKIKGVTDVSRMLEGQIAGVSIQNVSGTFGSAPKVRVRGATSLNGENKPLWVIDGVVHEDIVNISNDQLTSGDPATLLGSAVAGLSGSDIESISVLKDASATALYGARAMNGVVVVTTKRGKIGKPVISYSTNMTLQFKPTYDNYDIMNSANQMSVMAEMERKGYLNSDLVNSANSGVYGKMYGMMTTLDPNTGDFMLENTAQARETFLRSYAFKNTNWFDVLFRNSIVQDHSISISSGSETSRMYASMSYMNDDGWTIADKVSRFTANIRGDVTVGKFNLGFQVVGSVRDQKAPGTISRRTNSVEGTYDRDFDLNPFSYALNTSRMITPYDEDGNLEYFTRNYAPFNIIHELEKNFITLKVADIKAQIDAGYKIVPGLKWEFTGAVRYVKSDREHQIHETANMAEAYRAAGTSTIRSRNKFLYRDPDNPNGEPVVVLPSGGFYNRNEDMLVNFDVRNSLKYNFERGPHMFNAILGQQIKLANRQKFSNTGFGYNYDEGGTVKVDPRALKQMIESNFAYYGMGESRDRFAAFYANADYTYDRKYVLMGTVRYDGSNAMGKSPKARWFTTGTVSAKWNMGEEDFIKNLGVFDFVDLRASYGLNGSMPPYASSSVIFMNSLTNRLSANDIESAITLSSLENSELTWEKNYQTNIAFSFGVLKNRLDVTFDYWIRDGFDLVNWIKTSGIGGQTTKAANYTDMKSNGFDLTVNGTPIKTEDFKWNMSLTYGKSKSKITNAQNKPTIYGVTSADGGNVDGYPVNSLFAIEFVGLDPETGMPMFINENGKVANSVYVQSTNLKYLVHLGSIEPTYSGGFSNTFSYKNLSLNLLFTFQGGNVIRLNPAFKSSYTDYDALPYAFYDRWVLKGDEDQTTIPTIVALFEKSRLSSSSYPYSSYNLSTANYAKGDFVKLKSVSMTYNFPTTLLSKTKVINGASLTVAGTNLLMIYADKKLNGQDPEFFNTGGVAQPIQKQVTFALKVSF